MDKGVQMLVKELWRLGPDGSGRRGGKRVRERERKEGGGGEKKVWKGPGERTDERRRKESRGETERSPPCIEKRPESGIGVKKTMNAGGVENGI
ncbi:hypothetical protein TNCV_1708811 [Trichonephila clavipes]|nr:hypothetical protein TNCV_1708811 [Trichonephila clavipes]